MPTCQLTSLLKNNNAGLSTELTLIKKLSNAKTL
jgi:hypothetical protein